MTDKPSSHFILVFRIKTSLSVRLRIGVFHIKNVIYYPHSLGKLPVLGVFKEVARRQVIHDAGNSRRSSLAVAGG